ncbi:MAG: PDZ domain-containing protein, partial [Bacteroidales bacterium]|nr:PDZ domain-containing protein [Bacteroidales bacterium]
GDNDVRRSFEKQKPTDVDVSPDGKKFALAIRGLLYVSDTKCKYLQKLDTPSDERVKEVVWSGDSKTIYYTRTHKGYYGLYCISADNKGHEKVVYIPERNVKSLTVSHKGDKIAFVDGQRNLMLCTIADNSIEKVADAEFWSFWNYSLAFSFDDNFLAFESMKRFEPDIFICDLKAGKVTNLTNSASTETEMVFSPDGKNMFISAVITAASFPRGFNTALYKLPLQKYDTKFKSENYDNLFSKEKAKKDSSVVIDYENVFDRLQRVERRGTQSGLYIFDAKGKTQLFYSSYGDAGREVKALDINDPEARPKTIKGLMPGGFFASKTDLYHFANGTISKVDPNSLMTTPIEVSENVDKVLSDEFSQMFFEVWAVLEQNFYDVKLHGADWKAVRDHYSSLLPYVRSRDQLRTLVTDMLGELNSSHLGFTTSGAEEKTETRTHSILTGITFDKTSPYKVAGIVPFSPADKVDVDIKKGDELVAVDGVRIDPKQNREKYLSSPVTKDEVRLTFKRDGKENDIKVHTTSFMDLKSLMYRQWEDECKAKVDKDGNGRIAYVHMRAMGVGDLDNFYKEMHTYAVNRDALILDLRYNNGGNVHKEVIDFLRQKQHFQWSYRDFPTNPHPNVTPADKPIVVLVNEHSLSDAEVTSNGIKTLGVAKLVGTETYRWIIFTSSIGLIDGSSCRMPAWGCYNNEGLDLENIGVKPDIYVKTTFKDRISHEDPQLDAAIKEVLTQLKAK